jgi:hypothetical protein
MEIKVDALKEGTANYRARRQTNIEARLIDPINSKLVGCVDGIDMTRELMDLCNAVRAKMPDIKFGIPDTYKGVWIEPINQHVISDIWMYTEGDVYAPMRLSYRSHSRSSGGEWHYGVYSRTIINNSFALGHEKYHTNVCKSLAKAMKHVAAFYKPYTPQTVTRMAISSIQGNLRAIRDEKTREATQARNKVAMHPSFVRCMENLLSQDVTFVDPVVERLVKDMVAAYQDVQSTVARVDGYHVHVKLVADVQYFNVVYLENLEHVVHSSIHDNTQCVTYTADTLPEDIAGKVATLSIFPDVRFLAGVGKKMSQNEYWVLK